jgi:hypothetical protein
LTPAGPDLHGGSRRGASSNVITERDAPPAPGASSGRVLFPLTRKLGHLLEARTRDARGKPLAEETEIRAIVARLDALDVRLDAIADRQEFLDRLLMEQRAPSALGRGESE